MDIERRRKQCRDYYYRKPRKPCPVCGKLILMESTGCSKHHPYPQGEKHAFWKGGAKIAHERFLKNHPNFCIDCGKAISYEAKWCVKCSYQKKPLTKGGRFKTKGGYIKVKQPTHLRADQHGYVWEHIFTWEQTHNKSLPLDWIIHHLNGIPSDNRPVNL